MLFGSAFLGCSKLSSIRIPFASYFSYNTFNGCTSLSTMILSSVTTAPTLPYYSGNFCSTFANCPRPISVYLSNEYVAQEFMYGGWGDLTRSFYSIDPQIKLIPTLTDKYLNIYT